MACHISLKKFRRWLQLFFRPHLNRRSTHKVMGVQSCKSPNLGKFGDSNLGVPRQDDIWVLPLGQAEIILKWGGWWGSPSPGHVTPCESMFARGLSVHQKRSNYALTNLFGWCKSVWIIDLLVILPSPYPETPACPLPPKCYKARNVPQLHILLMFTLDSHLNLLRSLGVRQVVFVMLDICCNICTYI